MDREIERAKEHLDLMNREGEFIEKEIEYYREQRKSMRAF